MVCDRFILGIVLNCIELFFAIAGLIYVFVSLHIEDILTLLIIIICLVLELIALKKKIYGALICSVVFRVILLIYEIVQASKIGVIFNSGYAKMFGEKM